MEKAGPTELKVKRCELVTVAPSFSSPKTIFPLSSIDKAPIFKRYIFNSLLAYNARDGISAAPAKIIREALSKVLVYYFPFAGRLRRKENGELHVECTDEGALFVEAMADNNLSVLRDLNDINPSFHQLLFSLPLTTTPIENFHLLVVQVTQFICGGFVVGVSFHHSICDGRGAGQFLKCLAEMARGQVKPSLEPRENRELLNPEDFIHLQCYHLESILDNIRNLHQLPIIDELVQSSLVINSDIIKYIKKDFMEDSKECFSAFEIVGALVWQARTKVLQIPNDQNVKLCFTMDMRGLINPQLPQGYYGNAFGMACALDNVGDLIKGSLLRAAKIIKKSKVSLKDTYLMPRIVTYPSTLNMSREKDNMLALSDWRWLGFNEVDFGWGDPQHISSLLRLEKGLVVTDYFIFVQTPEHMPDGIKMLMCLPISIIKALKIEVESMINQYMDNKVQITTS